MGGMWGFYSKRNRDLADELFKLILSLKLSRKYNRKLKNLKGFDQFFLRDQIYSKIKEHSIIHDSYHCEKFKDSKPFPTKRQGDCFVGGINCNRSATAVILNCPKECRPKNHQDWLTC